MGDFAIVLMLLTLAGCESHAAKYANLLTIYEAEQVELDRLIDRSEKWTELLRPLPGDETEPTTPLEIATKKSREESQEKLAAKLKDLQAEIIRQREIVEAAKAARDAAR